MLEGKGGFAGGRDWSPVTTGSCWRSGAVDGSLREATTHHSVNGSFSIRAGRWIEMCPGFGGLELPPPRREVRGPAADPAVWLDVDIGERRNVEHEQRRRCW